MVEQYTYRVSWSDEDGEHIATCAEFPSLSYLHKDSIRALKGIQAVVRDCVADMESNGELIPEPLSTKKFSGKFQVRIPPEQHRKLAIKAQEENVSLNRLVSEKLAVA